jgi:tRNA dimethylallyltransferase
MTEDRKLNNLLVLIGPTAVGKTALSILLAKHFNAEIISGDSMQVYRGMDVGTAKISPDEMQGIPHYMIDTHEPNESFSVSEFQEQAERHIQHIHGRDKLPFVVGGTGLYIEALCYDFQFSEAGSDEKYRAEQTAYAVEFGAEALHNKLKAIDPEAAGRLHPNDIRRVIRSLEVYHTTGKTMTEHLKYQTKQAKYNLCIIGLTMDRKLLYERIEQRIDIMIEQGLVQEVHSLIRKGFSPALVALQGLGYKEIIWHLRGICTISESIRLLKRNTRRFAKRQLSWFRHMKDINWIDVTETQKINDHFMQINDIIAGKFRVEPEYNSEQ